MAAVIATTPPETLRAALVYLHPREILNVAATCKALRSRVLGDIISRLSFALENVRTVAGPSFHDASADERGDWLVGSGIFAFRRLPTAYSAALVAVQGGLSRQLLEPIGGATCMYSLSEIPLAVFDYNHGGDRGNALVSPNGSRHLVRAALLKWIDGGARVLTTSIDPSFGFCWACANGVDGAVDYYLTLPGVDPTMVELYPLLAAAANNYPGIFDQLVHFGHRFPEADVLMAQYITAGRGHVEMIKRLLALSRGELHGKTLIWAIHGGQDEMVGFLLSRIDDLYTACDDVDLALMTTCLYVSDDTVRAIIAKSGVDLSKDGNRFLHAAIVACRFSLVRDVFLPDPGVAALLPATNTFAFAGGHSHSSTDILRCIAAALGPDRLQPPDILGAQREELCVLLVAAAPGMEIPEDIVRLAARHNDEGVRALFPVPPTEDTPVETPAPPVESTRTYSFTVACSSLAPDGYACVAMLVNGQLPRPTIEADWDDVVEVHVTNLLETNDGNTNQFHGISQLGSNAMDGMPGITQCALAPGDSQVYRWVAEQYGFSWYHSHFSLQYGNDMLGPLIVRGPATADYDEELEPLVVMDWYHADGKGQFNGSASYHETAVVAGKKYLMRTVNSGTFTKSTHFLKFS
ncbi:hypothetical protein HK405_001315, partial [Cladochytrium tenue]